MSEGKEVKNEILDGKRLSLLPIKDNEVWTLYKKAFACFWAPPEIDLHEDLKDIKKLTAGERRFILYVLAFFNSSDIIVNKNISANFLNETELDTPEINCFYFFAGAMENIHSETYSILIDTLITDKKEKDQAFNAIENFPTIRAKADWVTKFMNKDRSLVERLFGFACVEGIQFSGSFCAIFWLKKRGLMPGLTFSNELISRDEALHTEFSCLMFKRQNALLPEEKRFTQENAHEIVRDCVEIEKKFVNKSLQIRLIGMNNILMNQYIESVADVILQMAGFEPCYHTKNPFAFMETISLSGKTNFFEKRVAEYQKSGIMNTSEEREFSLDMDF